MTSLNRKLAGEAMLFDLGQEIETTRAAQPPARAGRTARTLLKDGPLRLTLIVLHAGGEIAEHSTDGPITIHVLTGTIHVRISGGEHLVAAGQLLGAGAGVRHSVTADATAAFLLTVVQPDHAD